MSVRMTAAAANKIIDRFNNLSNEFAHSRGDVSTNAASITTAAGEFSGSIEDQTTAFELAWRETFDVGRESAGLIAGNTNGLKVDLDAIDQDFSWLPSL